MMADQFPPSEFDDCAPRYDQNTSTDRGFPFEGYSAVLRTIVHQATPDPGDEVLDMGIGTDNRALLFAVMGCQDMGSGFFG